MFKSEALEHNNFEVYEVINGKIHTICVCKEYKMADLICQVLANCDPAGDEYIFAPIIEQGTMIPGGGWKISYQKGEDGFLDRKELS